MTRVAAIDCGTNTIRLLIADLDPLTSGQHTLVREVRIARLGQDVDRTGRLADEAIARVFATTEDYASLVESHGVEAVRFVATSAARDADNSQSFAAGIRTRLGVDPEVVTGEEEARLAFDGATRGLDGATGPLAVLDLGGGSTEVITGDPPDDQDSRARVRAAWSLDIGSVRLTERLMPTDPPSSREVRAAVQTIDEALDELPGHGVSLEDTVSLVGVAGTVTTVAALALGLSRYDSERVHHSLIPRADVHRVSEQLLAATVAEREARGVPPGRSDVIGAGALILDRVVQRSGAQELLASESDILDGIAWSLVAHESGAKG